MLQQRVWCMTSLFTVALYGDGGRVVAFQQVLFVSCHCCSTLWLWLSVYSNSSGLYLEVDRIVTLEMQTTREYLWHFNSILLHYHVVMIMETSLTNVWVYISSLLSCMKFTSQQTSLAVPSATMTIILFRLNTLAAGLLHQQCYTHYIHKTFHLLSYT